MFFSYVFVHRMSKFASVGRIRFKSATKPRHFFLPLRHTEMRKFIDPCILPSPTRKTLGLHHFYCLIILHMDKKRNA
jgi:hypothetical protein